MTTVLDRPHAAAPPPPAPERTSSPNLHRRMGITAMLLGTALLYLWNLSASGWANEFYAAAVQSGTKSWKAFLFGSSDWGNSITVDKPPASLWPMELAGRIFGFNSWSMLAPQALMGVAAVGLLYLTVKRWFGTGAGFAAGILLAITPVAVLMFRFNNPDAMLTLLLVAATYCVTRAFDSASKRPGLLWMSLAGVAMGFSFLTKSLQGFSIIPGLFLAYVICSPHSIKARVVNSIAAAAALLVSAGWWIAIVALWPASSRPYIGGSTNNSALELALGYNGLGRITGESAGNGGGGGGGASFSGSTGIFRLFNDEMGPQIAWLIPTALIALVAMVALSARAARTDRTRAAAIIWGGWLLVTGTMLSFASGTIHSYYTIELAPAIAALVAIGGALLWQRRAHIDARLTMALGVLAATITSHQLLARDSSWMPWLSWVILIAGVAAVAALVIPPHRWAHAIALAAVTGVVALGGGSAAYAVATANTAHTGSTPSAGPSSAARSGMGGMGGGRSAGAGGFSGGPGGSGGSGGSSNSSAPGGTGGPGGSSSESGSGQMGTPPSGSTSGMGGMGGGESSTSSELIALLKKAGTTWSAATIGSQTAASLQLSSDTAVMPIGGFTGSDNSPTLAQFEALVKAGKIHYFIAGGGMGGGRGGSGGSSSITSWVEQNFTSTTVGGTTVYDLTQASSS